MVICRPDCFQSQEKLDQEVQFQEGTGKGDCQAYLIFEFFLHNRNLKPRNRNLTLEDGWMTNINRCAAKYLLQQLLGDIAGGCAVSILYVLQISAFLLFSNIRKGRLLYIRPVGRLVGRSVGRSVG